MFKLLIFLFFRLWRSFPVILDFKIGFYTRKCPRGQVLRSVHLKTSIYCLSCHYRPAPTQLTMFLVPFFCHFGAIDVPFMRPVVASSHTHAGFRFRVVCFVEWLLCASTAGRENMSVHSLHTCWGRPPRTSKLIACRYNAHCVSSRTGGATVDGIKFASVFFLNFVLPKPTFKDHAPPHPPISMLMSPEKTICYGIKFASCWPRRLCPQHWDWGARGVTLHSVRSSQYKCDLKPW